MADERYVRFARHYNNTNEVIDAEHVNELQRTSETTQKDIFQLKDYDFLDKALFNLEHHRVLNGLWIDLFQDTSKIDITRTSPFLIHHVEEQSVVFDTLQMAQEATLYSQVYVNQNESNLVKVKMIADYFLPTNTDITFEISNDNANWYSIEPNNDDVFEIPSNGHRIFLRATFRRQTWEDESPRLFGWGVLYYDKALNVIELPNGSSAVIGTPDDEWDGTINLFHNQLRGIGPDDHHPQAHTHDGTDGSGVISHSVLVDIGEDDHHDKNHRHGQDGVDYIVLDNDVIGTLATDHLSYQVWAGKPGDTGLYFDPLMGDRLVYVKTPDDETYLFYDMETERLTHTITILQGVAVWETLIYGNYTNSQGVTDVVLKGTTKVHHDAQDQKIIDEIAKVSAPTLVRGFIVSNLGEGGAVKLNWAANTEYDLAGYNVYMSVDGGVKYTKMNSLLITETEYIVQNLAIGGSYYFYVTAVDYTDRESAPSVVQNIKPADKDIIPPAVVENFRNEIAGDSVNLYWNQNVEADLSHYIIYRSTTGIATSFSPIVTVNVDSGFDTYYTDPNTEGGKAYYYFITAVDKSGNESVASNVIVVTAPTNTGGGTA